jgi:streptogramin lyase
VRRGLRRTKQAAVSLVATCSLAGLGAMVIPRPNGAHALEDRKGATIPNTSTASPVAQLVGTPMVVTPLARPFSPSDDDPLALAALASPSDPETDLSAALDALAGATDPVAAAFARQIAIDILEGNPITGRAYSGIPLLNWNGPARVKSVPPGGNVVVRQVRSAHATLSDTALLSFADPTLPYTITYRIAELGQAGVLTPTPLLADPKGTALGGLHSVVVPLALPQLPIGTTATSRFHPAGAAEITRLAVQDVTVAMPPPNVTAALLHPDLRPGYASLQTVQVATPARLSYVAGAFGFTGSAPTLAQKTAAIGRIGSAAPERILWDHLQALDPRAPGFLEAARSVGIGDRVLVGVMRSREAIPPGVTTPPGVDLTVVLLNDETYVSPSALRLAPGASLTVALVNADGFAHRTQVLELSDRRAVYGALDWGEFNWRALVPPGSADNLPPGNARIFTVTPSKGAFQLWVGDPDSGGQASAMVVLDRSPARQAYRFRPDFSFPQHIAFDADGKIWVTLMGVDAVARLSPGADFSSSFEERFPLPGGNPDAALGPARQAPHDIAVDGRGVVWATLLTGNAIARIDPSQVRAGTSRGITIYPLPPCDACPAPFPPEPQVPPSRNPEQLATIQDRDGNTILWFTEIHADAIGLMKVSPQGELLAQSEAWCACAGAKGIAVGPDGEVWFTSELDNNLNRLRPDRARPFDLARARIDHFPLPSFVEVEVPDRPGALLRTSGPHSVGVDGRGRVWVTEEEAGRVAFLDPSAAVPGTSRGFTEFALARNDFGGVPAPADLALDRAGTVFHADEYGDMIGSLTAAGPGRRWRPLARQSLTDKPALDTAGNLYFTEPAANLLSRILGVSEGWLPPAPPAVTDADVTAGTVQGSGWREATTVDIAVRRNGTVVTSAKGVKVTSGSFTVGPGAQNGWSTSATPALQGEDVVELTFAGRYPRGPIAFRLASLTATLAADGSVSGTATAGGSAAGETVRLTTGSASVEVLVDDLTGAWRHVPLAPLDPATTAGTVSWSYPGSAGVFNTTIRFGAPTSAPKAKKR